MTVLGPLPDHVARALRGESQEPQAAPREERAADSSAYLPPGGCEIDREYTRERVDQATPEQLAAAMRLTSVDHARAFQQLPPHVSLTGTKIKAPDIRTFMHELSDDERASIGKQILESLREQDAARPQHQPKPPTVNTAIAAGRMALEEMRR